MRAFIRTLTLLIALVSAVGWAFSWYLPKLLAKKLSHRLKTPVFLEKIVFTPRSFELHNLTVMNPRSSALPVAFQTRVLRFEAPYIRYFYPHLVIDQISLEDIQVGIEFYDADNRRGNWTELIENVKQRARGGLSFSPHLDEKTILVRHLLFTNIRIELLLQGSVRNFSPIPKIEFYDVTSEKGFPINEITALIARKLMEELSILKGFANMLKAIISIPEEAIKAVFFPFRFLFRQNSSLQPHEEREVDKEDAEMRF